MKKACQDIATIKLLIYKRNSGRVFAVRNLMGGFDTFGDSGGGLLARGMCFFFQYIRLCFCFPEGRAVGCAVFVGCAVLAGLLDGIFFELS